MIELYLLAGAIVSIAWEHIAEVLFPDLATIDSARKRLAVGGLTAVTAFVLIVIGCNGLLPGVIDECPERAAWLEIIVAAVAANVGGQAVHQLTRKIS